MNGVDVDQRLLVGFKMIGRGIPRSGLRILSFLSDKGHDGLNPTSKVGDDIYQMLVAEFQASKQTFTVSEM